MKQSTISNVFTGVLVACALVVTGLVVRRESASIGAEARTIEYPQPRTIAGAQDLAKVGNRMGPSDAAVTIVEFSDFQCSFCRDLYLTLEELRERHPGRVAVIYRHFPIVQIHPLARTAAIASECAAEQGKFFTYHSLLFDQQDSIGVRSWESFATAAGVGNIPQFRDCLASSAPAKRVADDIAAAKKLGIGGTPTLIIGNELVSAALPLDRLEAWIGTLGRP
jgi:protein-disulfide isomerase